MTPQTVVCQYMGFPRQEYWSGLSFSSLGDLPDPRIEPIAPALAEGFFTAEPLGKPPRISSAYYIEYLKSFHSDEN